MYSHLLLLSVLPIFTASQSYNDYIHRISRERFAPLKTSGYIHLDLYPGYVQDASERDTIFFLETSGRDTIAERSACGVESAARSLNLNVVYLMVTDKLDMSHALTREIYNNYDIKFYRFDLKELAKGLFLINLFIQICCLKFIE